MCKSTTDNLNISWHSVLFILLLLLFFKIYCSTDTALQLNKGQHKSVYAKTDV